MKSPDEQRAGATELRTVLAMDCGSTTTKAVLFELKEEGWRQTARGEAPTTVERPFEDVTIGARNAAEEVEERSGLKLLGPDGIIVRKGAKESSSTGVDLFVATSSAGGGLQMAVAGLIGAMSAESAQRAALGAGAIVTEVISTDDGRAEHERVRRLRELRPDILLLAGGVDGGGKKQVVEMAETILSASPRARFGDAGGFKLPVVYAGNKDAADEIRRLLENSFQLKLVENIRPTLEVENLTPARDAIHEVFLRHVMSHAPGYDKFITWSGVPVMSTPAAVGTMTRMHATATNADMIIVDIGGATTDVFSVFGNVFNRTVSANLGLSYSAGNVLAETGVENIMRWLPFDFDPDELCNRMRNKMIRPTTIPETMEDLWIEQAVAREALRLALLHHRLLAVGLKGVRQTRTIADALTQKATGAELVNMLTVSLIVGSGGVLSHAPDRRQAAMMLLDAFQPEGVTQLAVDSIFMMPHLGIFSTVAPDAAVEIFRRDCLVPLGTCVAPGGRISAAELQAGNGRTTAEVELTPEEGGTPATADVTAGSISSLPLAEGRRGELLVRPKRGFDAGAGKGNEVKTQVAGGICGVVLDGRGRPFSPPERSPSVIRRWMTEMGIDVRQG